MATILYFWSTQKM